MGEVISLHAERWIVGVFEESGSRVDVSTKGNVVFCVTRSAGPTGAVAHLTMEQMARLGEALSVAYKENEDG